MKVNFMLVLAAAAMLTACNTETKTETTEVAKTEEGHEHEDDEIRITGHTPAGDPIYGDSTIVEAGAIPVADLPKVLGDKDSVEVKVIATVIESCKQAGCWMDVKQADNSPMKVRFQNYGFFVPKDLDGKTVVFEGVAKRDTVSVADQKHYAQDAKKSKAEIDAITEDKETITFMATGVIVKKETN
jgi:hypothetical protein